MGTTALAANSTIRLSPGWNAFWFWGVWAVCLAGIAVIVWAALRSKRWARWTTQDILIVAALGVLLEVYDNIIGDQLIGPLINPIPGADFSQVQDLPYVFLLLVGVALIRKPGCVTAMVFVNFLLAQLLFGSGHGALDWTDGLTQGIFCDLYLVARRGRVFGPAASRLSMVADGFMIGVAARRAERVPDRLDLRPVPERHVLHLAADVERHLVQRPVQRHRGRRQRGPGPPGRGVRGALPGGEPGQAGRRPVRRARGRRGQCPALGAPW